jgi:hypothetical protein
MLFLPLLLGLQISGVSAAPIDWAQPPVACIEELAPRPESKPCPDLSAMATPTGSIRAVLSGEDLVYWGNAARAGELEVCRAREIKRRQDAGTLTLKGWPKELAWMTLRAVEDRDLKISEIYRASETHGLPPQILFGAFMQESYFADLGISADGGNFSCGIGQVNVREWCDWANSADAATKKQIEWPATGLPCDEISLPPAVVSPFFDIARSRAPGTSSYERGSALYEKISFASVKEKIAKIVWMIDMPPTIGPDGIPVPTVSPSPAPPPTAEVVATRYQAASSFTRYCSDVQRNIRAKALALRILYDEAVPAGLKQKDHYAPGEKFNRKCIRSGGSAYPLHTGWLTAVAMYNAGKKFIPRIASYFQMNKAAVENPAAWKDFTPKKLIEGLHWGGKYNAETKKLNYFDLEGLPVEASWYKACIVQRHVARVVGFSTLPGYEIVRALDRQGCAQAVPAYRKASSGFVTP